MAQANMPDEFYEIAICHLPPDATVGPDGGRPVIDHFRVLRLIWYVLVTGVRWRDVPEEMGFIGETARCRLRDWQDAGVWDRFQLDMLRLLRRDGGLQHETAIIDSAQVRASGGGERTGPSPLGRRKLGTKFTLMTDRNGVPLAITIAGGNRSDQREILPMIQNEYPHLGGHEPGPMSSTLTPDTTEKQHAMF